MAPCLERNECRGRARVDVETSSSSSAFTNAPSGGVRGGGGSRMSQSRRSSIRGRAGSDRREKSKRIVCATTSREKSTCLEVLPPGNGRWPMLSPKA
eukprot:5372198-Prymnesium_polylepis.1